MLVEMFFSGANWRYSSERGKAGGSLICLCLAAPGSSGRIWCGMLFREGIASRYSHAAAELPTYLPRLFD